MRKSYKLIILITLVLIILGLVYFEVQQYRKINSELNPDINQTDQTIEDVISIPVTFKNSKTKTQTQTKTIVANSNLVTAEISSTYKAKVQGLSGRLSLKKGEGMLFIFPKDGLYAFWMKDMNFPIDIIWLNAQKKIVSVSKTVTPESYPKTVTSSEPATYILEVPAGFADTHNITLDTTVDFSIPVGTVIE